MPRRRKSGVQPASFSIRWHSIADPTTPSVDIMSSPDPLNEPTVSISSVAPPSSSRRMTRSQRSQRFMSLDDSPRKRKFELELGNTKSPQRLLVTVETEEEDMDMTSGTRRKLFKSPVPTPTLRRMEQTTTTTVPLRDSIEDELTNPTTPRRRGRPRTSNGTPMPTAGVKRRAGTPIRRTPRRPRTTMSGEEEAEEAQSEASVQATPTSARRGRPPKNSAVEPSSVLGSAKRGARGRQALAPDELVGIAEETTAERSSNHQAAQMSENDMDLIRAPSELSIDQAAVASNADAESDIWMATMSDQATPRATTRASNLNLADSFSRAPRESAPSEPEANMFQTGDYGYLAPAASDSSSAAGPLSESGPQNNDTIAQGEDFSMIFMDSIPSLQASFHGHSSFRPAAHDDEELGEETNLIINNTLESLRQEVAENERMEITEPLEVLQPVGQEVSAEGESAHVQPEAALSPHPTLSPWWSRRPRKMGSSPLRHRVLKSSAKKSMMHKLEGQEEEGQSPTRDSRPTAHANIRNEDSNMYEDSFSEIPPVYLAAATPGRPDLITTHGDQEDDEIENALEEEQLGMEQNHEAEEDNEENPALSNAAAIAHPEMRRLPTPDKTPQLETEEAENQEDSAQDSSDSPRVESPTQPEGYQYDEEGMHQTSESPEQHEFTVERPDPSFKATPINQMSSPLQEPQSLPQEPVQEKASRPVLSSIVRAGRVLQSVTSDPPSPGDREKQLGSPFRSSGSKEDSHANRLMSKSPPQALNVARRQAAASSQAQVNEGLTGSAFSNMNVHGSKKPFDRSIEEQMNRNRPPSRESAASSMRITPPSDGVMSWVENEGPISPRLRGDNTLLQASGLSGVRVVREPVPLSQIDGAGEETDEEAQGGDDETDIWDFEAQRQPPPLIRRQPFGSKVAPSAALSPWARKSVQRPTNAVAESSYEQSKTARTTRKTGETGEAEEYSVMPQKKPEKEAESASKANRFDLSSFFSSPAAIPGMIAEKLFAASISKPAETVRAAPPAMPTSSMFPQVPQKEFNPRSGPRTNLFSPVRSKEPEKAQAVEHSSSPATPDKLQPPIIAQKQNFTPRPRQPSGTFFQPLSAHGAATVTPPRMQLSHADIHRWQQETSNASEKSPGFRPRLRPLPAKNASPIKSSLRSPLKPRTPGPVVEFTSSVLSPHEQALLREQRRRANSIQPRIQVGPPAPPERLEPQTNSLVNHNAADVTMSDTSLMAADKSPQPELLSKTVWTRQHWLFLDALLQLRREGPFERQYAPSSAKYLGKTVKSQGEAMTLERWHLDCVDAFKAEVGGWDEGVLAKRLFALILGEERRRRGMVDTTSTVMFH